MRTSHQSVFSPDKVDGVLEKHILGVAGVHIKGFGSTSIPHQRVTALEGWGPISLMYAGRTLMCMWEVSVMKIK